MQFLTKNLLRIKEKLKEQNKMIEEKDKNKKVKKKQISWVRRAVSSVKEECLFSPGMERATREHMYPPHPPTLSLVTLR